MHFLNKLIARNKKVPTCNKFRILLNSRLSLNGKAIKRIFNLKIMLV